ncbi:MAG: DUF2203 domain-containing protein [Chlorobiaceae bacterium]|nr:DUF2203 domain-containing protein [Chlorobiaceae bacterium]MBA4310899.1 DUF2203 domain-containing protein [Chlorobiaceae bacterium]
MTETKYFNPKEANRTLPLVRKIVEDILFEGREIKLIAKVFDGNLNDNPEVRARVDVIQGYLDELHEIGCYYKDFAYNVGLVDFPAIIDGEEVLLCWRSDEVSIRYYHHIDAGYKGRKLIPAEYLD